jgi:hypothetical protein
LPRRASLAALLAAAALASADAPAQTFYKWTDATGKIQYSDVPPKNFKGDVTRLEVEPSPPTRVPERPVAAPATDGKPAEGKAAEGKPPEDMATKRRSTRERLEAQLERAREKVEIAKKALEDGETPENDERQVIQQRAATGGQHGMAPRSNCRIERDGKGMQWHMCPTTVPTQDYHDRIARLEANLKKAEEELAAAQLAWRRGVD